MPKIKFTDLSIKNLAPGDKSVEYFEIGRRSGDGTFGIRSQPIGEERPGSPCTNLKRVQ